MRIGLRRAANSFSAESRFRMIAAWKDIPMRTFSATRLPMRLLGAIGESDIGHHFPNTDESIRGISSLEILRKVNSVLGRKNARAVNVDATVIAEAPKIAPHIPAMREKIAAALNLETSRVSIKATTNEGLGAIGRGEGMAAMAVATVEDHRVSKPL